MIAQALALGCAGTLVWTWGVYPALMVGVSRLRGGSAAPSPKLTTDTPRVTVVIASRDEPSRVTERLADVLATSYPADRLDIVLCIDAGASPDMREGLHALRADRIRVVDGDAARGKAATLNAGVRVASGDVLVFTDVQQRFEPDTIPALVRALSADPRIAVAGGALYLPGDRPGQRRSPVEWYWAGERQLRRAEAQVHSSIGVSGSIYAMWASAWVPMPPGLILDDVFVPMQQVLRGRRVAYTLDARAWDVRRTSHDAERVRKVRTLTGNFQLVAWMPALLVPIRNPVWLQFVSHKMLRLASPWLLMGAAIGTLFALRPLLSTIPLWVVVAMAAAAMLAFVMPPFGAKLRGLARWVASLNSALVQASINGARGHWDVW